MTEPNPADVLAKSKALLDEAIQQALLDAALQQAQPTPDAMRETLQEALYGLSARLLLSGFLEDADNHAAYEKVVAAHAALEQS